MIGSSTRRHILFQLLKTDSKISMIIIVIGPPASGKTHLCSRQTAFKHVEIDKYLPIQETGQNYKEKRTKVVELLLENVTEPTIFDDTFHLSGMRKPFLSRAAELGVGFGILQMPLLPFSLLLERNKNREHSIPHSSIIKIYNSFEPLTKSEQQFQITSLTDSLHVPKMPQTIHSFQTQMSSEAHSLDCKLRKLTNEAIQRMKIKAPDHVAIIIKKRQEFLKSKESNRAAEEFSIWLTSYAAKLAGKQN